MPRSRSVCITTPSIRTGRSVAPHCFFLPVMAHIRRQVCAHMLGQSARRKLSSPWEKANIFAARLCAVLSLLAALLGAAPFTPAPVALMLLVPFAALSAWRGYYLAPIITALCVPGALALSPIKWSELLSTPAVIWLVWVSCWAFFTLGVAVRGVLSKGQGQGSKIDA